MDITISLNAKEIAAVQTACDTWNAEQEREWTAAQQGLPPDQRTPYAPVTAQRYFKERCGEMVRSYLKQVDEAEEATLTRRFRRLTDEQKAALVASLPAEP